MLFRVEWYLIDLLVVVKDVEGIFLLKLVCNGLDKALSYVYNLR